MIIDMPHTPDELAESFAKRDIEVDIIGIKREDADAIAEFLLKHGFSAVYYSDGYLADLIFEWSQKYGILVSDEAHDVGANPPDRHFGTVRFTVEDVMKILGKQEQTISDEDFESVF